MKLDNITLVSIVGSDKYLDNTIKAINYCMKQVEFKRIKLLSSKNIKLQDIEVINITQLNKEEYGEEVSQK